MLQEIEQLREFLRRIPAVNPHIGSGDNQGLWWLKFQIDIDHLLAWNVVQELGNIINYLSVEERLPTKFFPVSPPVYLNGGPKEYLSWVIECEDAQFTPRQLQEWLEARMPKPVDDLKRWVTE